MMIKRSLLSRIMDILDCQSSDIQLLGGYYNNVYEIELENPIVIKIYNKKTYDEHLILSEIEWIEFLYDNGVITVVPIFLNKDSYINELSDNNYFVAFRKVNGKHIKTSDIQVWNNKLFANWGMGMAKMHSLASSFRGKYNRPEWYEHELFKVHNNQLDEEIKNKWNKYVSELKKMTKSKRTYGIIHGDLHHHNFLVNKGELIFIDFGDSEYHWFVYDVAIAVYHAAQTVSDVIKRREFAKIFLNSFLNGYSQNFSTTEIETWIDYFVNFRHLYSYVYNIHYLDKRKLNEQQFKNLEEMRTSLNNQDSYLGILLV
jgi:Ser/Thr protein kinase RdoA (MazF antagonist)